MKRNILLLTALFIFGTLFAQEDSQNAVVSVENDYNPTIVTVNKKSFTPTVESKSQAKPAELIFSKQTTPYTGFVSEKNTKELLPAQERPLPGYLRVGYGIRNDIDAKLAYNLNFGTKSYLRVLGADLKRNTSFEVLVSILIYLNTEEGHVIADLFSDIVLILTDSGGKYESVKSVHFGRV